MPDMQYVRKALDTVAGSNFARQDLSSLLTLTVMPKRPTINALAHKRATNTSHLWDEQPLTDPTGKTASFNQGNKPANNTATPNQLSNNTANFGRTAQVTDVMAAVWTGAGGYRMMAGDMEMMLVEAIELNSEEQMEELLNELEYVTWQGNHANNSTTIGSEQSQFDGLALAIDSTSTAANGAGQSIDAGSALLTEANVRDLARKIRAQKGAISPDSLFLSVHDTEIANQWHPSQYVIGVVSDMTGGFNITQYNTGFSIVNVITSDWLPSGKAFMLNLKENAFLADLIPLSSEPLPRIATAVERMIQTVTTLEMRAIQTSTGYITNLSTS